MALFETLPYDPKGDNPINLRLDERHQLAVARNRVLVPHYGPFYAQSFVIRSLPDNVVLTEGQDYELLFDIKEATVETGLRVVSLIYVHNTEIQGEVSMDLRNVGGEFGSYAPAIQYAMEQLEMDNRSVSYDSLLGVPESFPPSYHIHSMYDTFGWEDAVNVMKDIRAAIEFGSEERYDSLVGRIAGLEQAITDVNAAIGDVVNPAVYGKKTFVRLPNEYIASVGTFLVPDNQSGACTYPLPPNPKDGDMIEWVASDTPFSQNPMTFTVSDKNIEGDAEGMVINQDRVCGRIVYRSALNEWRVYQTGLKGLAGEA